MAKRHNKPSNKLVWFLVIVVFIFGLASAGVYDLKEVIKDAGVKIGLVDEDVIVP